MKKLRREPHSLLPPNKEAPLVTSLFRGTPTAPTAGMPALMKRKAMRKQAK